LIPRHYLGGAIHFRSASGSLESPVAVSGEHAHRASRRESEIRFAVSGEVVEMARIHHLGIAYTAHMSYVEKHLPGSFCWMELGTNDQLAGKSFYTSLFGWEYSDSPMGPNDYYTMFTLENRSVAAAYTLRPEQISQGVPPHWNLYISVESADTTTTRAAECGGTVFAGPFDVYTHGRMSVIADPTGAAFSVWEPKSHTGIGVQRQHGSFCWADLSTPDPARAAEFYKDVFGWSLRPGDGDYLHIANGDEYIGGIPPANQRAPHEPAHWLIYFQVDDCDAATAKAKELGANVFAGPMTIEHVGRMTVLADPQGAVFSLFQPLPH
jgi:predicted enzyme related to lactoylglutathione lyase